MNEHLHITLHVEPEDDAALHVDAVDDLGLAIGEKIVVGDAVPYGGPYEVTPTQGTQVLDTKFLKMLDNVTVNPIPSNYGLITWNGSYLMVS